MIIRSKQSLIVEFSLFIFFLLTAALFVPLTSDFNGFGFDGRFYAASRNPELFPHVFSHHAPWSWRVLSPFLASLLPFDRPFLSFVVLTVISSFLCLITLRAILIELGISMRPRIIATTLYCSVFWNLSWGFHSPAYIDSTTHFFTLLMIYLALRKFWILILPVLICATLQKESALLLTLTLAAIHFSTYKNRKISLLYLACLVVLSGMAHGAIRYVVPVVNEFSPEAVFRFFLTDKMTNPLFWKALPLTLVSALGITWAPLLASPKLTGQSVKAFPWLLIFFVLSSLQIFLGADSPRILADASLPIILTSSLVLEKLKPPAYLIPVFLMLCLWIGGLLSVTRDSHAFIGYYMGDNPLVHSPTSLADSFPYVISVFFLGFSLTYLITREPGSHMQHLPEKLV